MGEGMSQLHAFLLSAAFGVFCGFFRDALYPLRRAFRGRAWEIAADALTFAAFGAGYLFFALFLGLPAFRLYHFLGLCLGFFLYLKSFHKIVAFFGKKVYNFFRKISQKTRALLCRGSETIFRKRKRRGSR